MSQFPQIDDFYNKLLEYISSLDIINDSFMYMDQLQNYLDTKEKDQNFTNYDILVEEIKKRNDIKNEELGIKDKDDLINIMTLVKKTEDYGLIKFFTQPELEQDIITDIFYVNNVTINNSIYHNYFHSSETKFKLFFGLQSILSKLLLHLENKNLKDNSNFKMTFGINSYPDHYNFSQENDFKFFSVLCYSWR